MAPLRQLGRSAGSGTPSQGSAGRTLTEENRCGSRSVIWSPLSVGTLVVVVVI